MLVRDVMTHGVIGVAEDTGIGDAIETMLRSRVSALFVFDAKHELSGILSQGDLLRRDELGSERKRPGWLEFLLGSGRLAETYVHEHGRKVGEVMTRDVETIEESAELSEAVDRMICRSIKRLAVLRGEKCRWRHLALRPPQGTFWPRRCARRARIPMPRSRPPSRRSSTSSTGRRAPSVRIEVQERRRHLQRRDNQRAASRRPQGHCRQNTPGCVAVHDHMAWIEPNSGVVIPSAGDDPKA